MFTLLLYVLALILPFIGFALLGMIVRFFSAANLRAKTRMHNANIMTAERAVNSGELRLPSWGPDKQKALLFIETIQQLAMHKGVPRRFLQGLLSEIEGTKALFFFAGAMEQSGASFLEQQVACADKLVAVFERTSEAGRREMIEKGEKSVSKYFDDEIPF